MSVLRKPQESPQASWTAADIASQQRVGGIGDTHQTVLSGALIAAIPIAMFAGLISFFSPFSVV